MNEPNTATRPLKIGYLWQYETVDMSRTTASVLHVKAVRGELINRGHQVRLVTFRQGQIHYSDDLAQWQPASLGLSQNGAFRLLERTLRGIQGRLRLPFFRLFDSYRFAAACRSALAGFDAMYERFWLMGYGGLIAAKRLGLPLIYEVNGDLVEEYAQLGIELSPAQWKVIHFVTRRMFQQAGRVITVSDTLRDKTIERWQIDPAQVVTVENGAMVDMFAAPADSHTTLARYQLNGAPVVMFVGSFKPWHGIDLLVDAFAQVAQRHPSARLVLVGDGPTRPELEAQVARLNLGEQVLFTGVVPHQEVAALLSGAQVAVVNPKVSGASSSQSPLKLYEYMAAGKAVVAPEIDNIKRVLVNRQNGLLIPPNNCEALAAALSDLLQNPALSRQLGAAARQDALAKHSWRRAVSEIEDVMMSLITPPKD